MSKVIEIEGVGEVYSEKLVSAGVGTTEELLAQGATPAGRKALADKTRISQKLILKWVNRADLFRVSGIGEEYSDLLEFAGVDTVVELARRNPDELVARLAEVNQARKLVRALPGRDKVANWVQQARLLPAVVSH